MPEELTEKQITQQVEDAGTKERVNVLEPDFILILGFALLMDGLDIIFFVIKLLPLGIPGSALHVIEIIDTPVDLFTFAVVGAWTFWRNGRMAEKRKEKIQALKKNLPQQVSRIEQGLIKRIPSPLRRVVLRQGASMAAESSNFLLPLLGAVIELIPFWAISVILTLRDK